MNPIITAINLLCTCYPNADIINIKGSLSIKIIISLGIEGEKMNKKLLSILAICLYIAAVILFIYSMFSTNKALFMCFGASAMCFGAVLTNMLSKKN